MACAAEFQRLREGYITQTSTQSFVQKRVTLCVWPRAWDTPTIETQRLALKNALRPSQRLIHASGLRAPGSGSTGQQVPLYTLCLSLYSKVSLKKRRPGPRAGRGVLLFGYRFIRTRLPFSHYKKGLYKILATTRVATLAVYTAVVNGAVWSLTPAHTCKPRAMRLGTRREV